MSRDNFKPSIKTIGKSQGEYSDGPIEDKLLQIFMAENQDEAVKESLHNNPSWAEIYHLSPLRENLLNWYDFGKSASVLEVGAGCGAVTSLLVRKAGRVVALDISERRSRINGYRNREAENLELVVGNIENFKPRNKFDFVVCIGVLEYSGRFIKDSRPYQTFLEILLSYVKPGGKLLLAIENRLGLKYWSGSREDHTGKFFDSIMDYPGNPEIKTFGRTEIERLLLDTGFSELSFYYPHPDYKMPRVVFSDDYLPGVDTDFPLGMLPSPAPDQNRAHVFSEQLAMRSIEANGLYPYFSNSFLIEAKVGKR